MEQQLIDFICRELAIPKSKISLDSSLVEDLGIVGVDGELFIRSFAGKFSADVSKLVSAEYFGGEESGNPVALFFPIMRSKLKPLLIRDLLKLIPR